MDLVTCLALYYYGMLNNYDIYTYSFRILLLDKCCGVKYLHDADYDLDGEDF